LKIKLASGKYYRIEVDGNTRRCFMFEAASVSRRLTARAANLESLLSARKSVNVDSTTTKSPLGDTATVSNASVVLEFVPKAAVENPSAQSSHATADSKSSAAHPLGGKSG
jgi:hypothetical protein